MNKRPTPQNTVFGGGSAPSDLHLQGLVHSLDPFPIRGSVLKTIPHDPTTERQKWGRPKGVDMGKNIHEQI